jgi:hypothetical protein
MSADQGEHGFLGTRPNPYAQAFVQFRADQARSGAYKLRNSGCSSDDDPSHLLTGSGTSMGNRAAGPVVLIWTLLSC